MPVEAPQVISEFLINLLTHLWSNSKMVASCLRNEAASEPSINRLSHRSRKITISKTVSMTWKRVVPKRLAEKSTMSDSTILVVDDSPADRAIAAKLLSGRTDYSVLTASNGQEAIEMINKRSPVLVVTDLQMPEMDGLQLVVEVRQRYPHLPCVLITARGSEELAAEAIRRGAASYVPKRRMAEILCTTVLQVLAASHRQKKQREIDKYRIRREFEYCMPSDATKIELLVTRLQQLIAERFLLDEIELIQTGIALSEALRNAIDHGNLELDSELKCSGDGEFERLAEFRRNRQPWCDRRVWVVVRETADAMTFTVRDEGSGFDAVNLDYDPTSSENLSRPCGRGLFLIREFMDEVTFNESGNEISLVKTAVATDSPGSRTAPQSIYTAEFAEI